MKEMRREEGGDIETEGNAGPRKKNSCKPIRKASSNEDEVELIVEQIKCNGSLRRRRVALQSNSYYLHSHL